MRSPAGQVQCTPTQPRETMHYDFIEVPADGEAITANPDHTLNVPDRPIIPFIEGDALKKNARFTPSDG